MTDKENPPRPEEAQQPQDEDEPDEWEERINRTGCAGAELTGAAENERLTDCFHETKDWRACTAEMTAFRDCWQKHSNDTRTDMKDADKE